MSEELQSERIEELIAGYLTGTLSPEEARELEQWADQSPTNRQKINALNDPDHLLRQAEALRRFDAGKAWRKVERRYYGRRIGRIAYSAAGAAAVLALTAGIYFSFRTPHTSAPAVQIAERIDPAAVKLHRGTGGTLAVDSVRNVELPGALVESSPQGMTVTARPEADRSPVVYNTVEVPVAKRFDVVLADGTRVSLNAGSSLRFPDRFREKASREVYLTGEAFFTVSKDARRPFIVHTGDRYVRVTGTEFNVNCYDGAEQVTTLVSGTVHVGRMNVTGEVTLTPGMQAMQRSSGTQVVTRRVDVSEYTAWLDGLFAFRDKPLREILQSVSRWYGCRVVFENPVKERMRYSGTIARSSSLDEIAEYFSHTADLSVARSGDTLVVR